LTELRNDQRISVSERQSPEEYIKNISASQPDVLVFDHTIIEPDSLTAVASCKKLRSSLKMLLIGTDEDDTQIAAAFAAGVDGYLSSAQFPSLISEAIRSVAAGRAWIPRRLIAPALDLTRRLSSRAAEGANAGVGDSFRPRNCSPREQRVLDLLVNEGLGNKEIGARMGIEERTVETNVTGMLRKLGLSNRCQLIIFAIRNGLVPFKPVLPNPL